MSEKAPWLGSWWSGRSVWVGMKDGKLSPGLSGSLIKREGSCGSGQTLEAGEAALGPA